MEAGLARVEAALRGAVRTEDEYLTELASHLIVAGGKRLRPVVAMAAAGTRQDTISDDVVQGGVSVELVHLGSLYHDDVMDEADTRRGVETVNAKWGNLQAILAGDFLLSRASEIAASLGTEIAGLLANTIGRLCYGEIGQLRRTYSAARTEAEYLESIGGKTASLLPDRARVGAPWRADRPDVGALTSFGHVRHGLPDRRRRVDLTATEAQLGKPAATTWSRASTPCRSSGRWPPAMPRRARDLLGPLDRAEVEMALGIVRSNGGGGPSVGTHYVSGPWTRAGACRRPRRGPPRCRGASHRRRLTPPRCL
jgi:heptaprenyl diphosphate synthase